MLEKLFASRLAYLANTGNLLNDTQLGGRKQRSAVDTALLLLHYIQQHKKGSSSITTTILLDIKGAFDHVKKDKLLQVLHELQLPDNLISWVSSFLTNRKIQLAFEGQIQQLVDLEIGVPQGSPISPILFLIYIRNILADRAYQLSYIDDFSLSVTSSSAKENCRQIEEVVDKLFAAATQQGAQFDPGKTELIHFSTRREVITEGVKIANLTIKPVKSGQGCSLLNRLATRNRWCIGGHNLRPNAGDKWLIAWRLLADGLAEIPSHLGTNE